MIESPVKDQWLSNAVEDRLRGAGHQKDRGHPIAVPDRADNKWGTEGSSNYTPVNKVMPATPHID